MEQALKQLEKKVKDLETGELSLEDSLKRFEEGVKLVRTCQDHLKKTEQKIEILKKDIEGNFVREEEVN